MIRLSLPDGADQGDEHFYGIIELIVYNQMAIKIFLGYLRSSIRQSAVNDLRRIRAPLRQAAF